MKNLLLGFMILPSIIGLIFINHTLLVSKSDGQSGEITNRIVRLELAWLAMNKPHLFKEIMPELTMNIEDKHKIEQTIKQRELVNSSAFDYEYFIANNPDLILVIAQGKNKVEQYWFEHLDECRKSSPVFNVKRYQKKYPDIVNALGSSCKKATYHWFYHGIDEGRSGI